eukprot:s2219_g5.t1
MSVDEVEGYIESRHLENQLTRCRADIAAFTRTLVRAKEAVKMAAQTQNMTRGGKAWHFGCFSVTCAQKDGQMPVSHRGYTVKLQKLGSSGFCGRTEERLWRFWGSTDQVLVAVEPTSNSSAMAIWVRCAAFAEVCGESNSELDLEQIFLLVLICVVTLVVIATGILMLQRKRPKRCAWREPTRQSSFTSTMPGVTSSSIGPLSNRSGPIPKILIWPPEAEDSPPVVYSPKEEPRRSTEISSTILTQKTPTELRRLSAPVPLVSFKSNTSFSSERGVAPYTRSKSSSMLSGDVPNHSPSSSFSSSLNSTFVSKQLTSVSFRWQPGDAFIHCWHRKLSDTYQDYNMVNLIGEGRNGAVFIVQHKISEQYYACKVLHKAEQDSSALRAEIKNLRMLDHPHLVRLYEVNEDAEAVFLLMEYCSGGDLFSLVTESPEGRLPEKTARSFAEQMLSALQYCHSIGIVHRDVKPENFLLEGAVGEDASTATLKLADFGIATHIRSAESLSEGQVNGSVPYMAPELFTKRWSSLVRDSQGDRQVLAASDLWSCGIVIYVMLSGDLPYGSDEYRIANGEPPDFSKEVWQSVSPEAIDLIRKLLQPDVEERWTASQAVRHEWFASKTTRASPESQGRSTTTHLSEGFFSQGAAEYARATLRGLRRWRQHPFLRRMVMAGIAKRMEADNPARKFAELAYQTFKGSQDQLRKEQLVQVLNSAFCGAATPPDATGCSNNTSLSNESFLQGEAVRTTRSNSSVGSGVSPSYTTRRLSFCTPKQRRWLRMEVKTPIYL